MRQPARQPQLALALAAAHHRWESAGLCPTTYRRVGATPVVPIIDADTISEGAKDSA